MIALFQARLVRVVAFIVLFVGTVAVSVVASGNSGVVAGGDKQHHTFPQAEQMKHLAGPIEVRAFARRLPPRKDAMSVRVVPSVMAEGEELVFTATFPSEFSLDRVTIHPEHPEDNVNVVDSDSQADNDSSTDDGGADEDRVDSHPLFLAGEVTDMGTSNGVRIELSENVHDDNGNVVTVATITIPSLTSQNGLFPAFGPTSSFGDDIECVVFVSAVGAGDVDASSPSEPKPKRESNSNSDSDSDSPSPAASINRQGGSDRRARIQAKAKFVVVHMDLGRHSEGVSDYSAGSSDSSPAHGSGSITGQPSLSGASGQRPGNTAEKSDSDAFSKFLDQAKTAPAVVGGGALVAFAIIATVMTVKHRRNRALRSPADRALPRRKMYPQGRMVSATDASAGPATLSHTIRRTPGGSTPTASRNAVARALAVMRQARGQRKAREQVNGHAPARSPRIAAADAESDASSMRILDGGVLYSKRSVQVMKDSSDPTSSKRRFVAVSGSGEAAEKVNDRLKTGQLDNDTAANLEQRKGRQGRRLQRAELPKFRRSSTDSTSWKPTGCDPAAVRGHAKPMIIRPIPVAAVVAPKDSASDSQDPAIPKHLSRRTMADTIKARMTSSRDKQRVMDDLEAMKSKQGSARTRTSGSTRELTKAAGDAADTPVAVEVEMVEEPVTDQSSVPQNKTSPGLMVRAVRRVYNAWRNCLPWNAGQVNGDEDNESTVSEETGSTYSSAV